MTTEQLWETVSAGLWYRQCQRGTVVCEAAGREPCAYCAMHAALAKLKEQMSGMKAIGDDFLQQIATLTAERDEARKCAATRKEVADAADAECRRREKQVDVLTKERDELDAERQRLLDKWSVTETRMWAVIRERDDAAHKIDLLLEANGKAGRQLTEYGDEINSRGARVAHLEGALLDLVDAIRNPAGAAFDACLKRARAALSAPTAAEPPPVPNGGCMADWSGNEDEGLEGAVRRWLKLKDDAPTRVCVRCKGSHEGECLYLDTHEKCEAGTCDCVVPCPAAIHSTPEAPLSPGEPRWAATLRNLPPNWNSYGAPPIDPRAVATAIAILGTPGSVTPTNHGGVQVEWHCGGVDLEFVVNPDGSIEECECGEQVRPPRAIELHVATLADALEIAADRGPSAPEPDGSWWLIYYEDQDRKSPELFGGSGAEAAARARYDAANDNWTCVLFRSVLVSPHEPSAGPSDSEMLDWLEKDGISAQCVGAIVNGFIWRGKYCGSLRGTIRAAMRKP